MIPPEQVAEVLEQLAPYFMHIIEVQLKDYGESANAGCWVSFRYPDPESLEPYRGQDRSGRNARTGKRYKLLIIEIQDDEMPTQQDEPKARKLSQIAGAICHDPNFRAWAQDQYGESIPDEAAAAKLVREVCGIESRSFLDVNEDAGKVFRELLADYDAAKR